MPGRRAGPLRGFDAVLPDRRRAFRILGSPALPGRKSRFEPPPRRPLPTMTRKLFVTTALPYANAPFHIGHMMEYIQADIWVRFQRM